MGQKKMLRKEKEVIVMVSATGFKNEINCLTLQL